MSDLLVPVAAAVVVVGEDAVRRRMQERHGHCLRCSNGLGGKFQQTETLSITVLLQLSGVLQNLCWAWGLIIVASQKMV